MHICHIITRLIIGGAQENTVLTCEGLHARGHRVTLITGPETGPEGSLLERARSGGYDLRILDSMRRAVHPARDWRAKADLRALLRELKPDVVHTHSSKAGILGRMAARNASVPIILHTIHGMSFNRTQPWPIRRLYAGLERYCGRFTDRIITVADAMIDQAVTAGLAPREKFTTVYSGMQTEWFSSERYDRATLRRSWGFRESDVVVGTVARLFRNKGYEQLIPAMADAARRCPDLRFVWIGDGANRSDYEAQLAALGLRERVHLTGLIPPQQVAEVLAGIDILAHASQWEGLPRAAVQALLMQHPVISFAIDGAPEVVIPGRTGVLIPLNDTVALAEAMVQLVGNAEARTRLGRTGRELCLHRFDWRTMVEGIEKICLEIAKAKGIAAAEISSPKGAVSSSPGLPRSGYPG